MATEQLASSLPPLSVDRASGPLQPVVRPVPSLAATELIGHRWVEILLFPFWDQWFGLCQLHSLAGIPDGSVHTETHRPPSWHSTGGLLGHRTGDSKLKPRLQMHFPRHRPLEHCECDGFLQPATTGVVQIVWISFELGMDRWENLPHNVG